MNSIATQTRIEPSRLEGIATGRAIATALASVLLAGLLIGFKPLNPGTGPAAGEGGDIVNQLGYGSLGALALLALLLFADPRRLAALASFWWALLLGFFVLSILRATDPGSAARSASFSFIIILGIAAAFSLPRDMDSFSTVLKTSAILVLGLSYMGLVVFPTAAIHGSGGFEAQHAGFWRGIYPHKNVAGPVMACLAFCGLYLYRRGERRIGIAIFVAAMLFVLNTGSKTTAGLVPAAMLLVILPNLIGMRRLVPLLYLTFVIAFGLGTLGIVYIGVLKDFAATHFPDLTYTGRTTLWEFGGEMILQRPWTGYGYVSFWGTDFLTTQDQPFDRAWDIRGIVHGHDGYMDIAIQMGIPAMLVSVMTFIIAPVRDYMRVPPRRENVFLADFLMMVVLFTTLNAFLETFFFHRTDPVWVMLVLGTLGMRIPSRIALHSRTR
ncbi:MAG: O-antigen ligase family protein [Notoacmeibacter sp.]|nr:O-antigen ligase family protein [Notoacmeibacter sp.]